MLKSRGKMKATNLLKMTLKEI